MRGRADGEARTLILEYFCRRLDSLIDKNDQVSDGIRFDAVMAVTRLCRISADMVAPVWYSIGGGHRPVDLDVVGTTPAGAYPLLGDDFFRFPPSVVGPRPVLA